MMTLHDVMVAIQGVRPETFGFNCLRYNVGNRIILSIQTGGNSDAFSRQYPAQVFMIPEHASRVPWLHLVPCELVDKTSKHFNYLSNNVAVNTYHADGATETENGRLRLAQRFYVKRPVSDEKHKFLLPAVDMISFVCSSPSIAFGAAFVIIEQDTSQAPVTKWLATSIIPTPPINVEASSAQVPPPAYVDLSKKNSRRGK
jgi:hypothetical protein